VIEYACGNTPYAQPDRSPVPKTLWQVPANHVVQHRTVNHYVRLKEKRKIDVEASLGSPRLNACQEFGKLAARLHAAKFVGGLDITHCKFEPDGTLIAMFSIGRGRILELPLAIEERAKDLATLKKQLSSPEWEAIKLGYQFSAPDDAEEVLAKVEQPNEARVSELERDTER